MKPKLVIDWRYLYISVRVRHTCPICKCRYEEAKAATKEEAKEYLEELLMEKNWCYDFLISSPICSTCYYERNKQDP